VVLADHDLDVDAEVVGIAEDFENAAAGLAVEGGPVGDLDVDDNIVIAGARILGAGLNVTQTSFAGNEDNENDEHDCGDEHDCHDAPEAIDVDGGVFFLGIEGGEGNAGGNARAAANVRMIKREA